MSTNEANDNELGTSHDPNTGRGRKKSENRSPPGSEDPEYAERRRFVQLVGVGALSSLGAAGAYFLGERLGVPPHSTPNNGSSAMTLPGVRVATAFADKEHSGTSLDPWPGSAIQAALDDLKAAGLGGTVYLPAGEYLIAAPIGLYGGISLIGAGLGNWTKQGQSNTVLKLADGANSSVLTVDSYPPNQYWANIRDLTIDGNAQAQTAENPGISWKFGPADSVIEDVVVRNVNGDGIFLREGWSVKLRGIWSEANKRAGIRLRTPQGHGSVLIDGCSLLSNENGIFLDCLNGLSPVCITGCEIDNNSNCGLYFLGYSGYGGPVDVSVSNCVVSRNATAGLYVGDNGAYDGYLQVRNTHFRDQQTYCIHAEKTTSLVVDIEASLLEGASVSLVQRELGFPQSNLVLRRNLGYVTEARGTATIRSGQTSTSVAHGLSSAPLIVTLGPRSPEVKGAYVVSRDSTQFVAEVESPVTADSLVDWYAEV